MATMYAGPGNVYVPSFDLQANLIVNYSRDPKKFKVNELMTVTPVDKPINKYLRIKPEVAGNITDNWNASRRWADGSPMPIQLEGGQKHEWLEYFTERYVETFPLGYQTENNAIWDIVKTQSEAMAGRMMTGVAVEAYSVLTTAANYDNTDTATNAGGGKWDVATSTTRYIQNSLATGVQAIQKSTMNGVQPEDLVLVLSPNVAKQMAQSAEIADYVAQGPAAWGYLQGNLDKSQYGPSFYGNYGLPPVLYGIKVIVDPLVKDTAALGATSSKSEVAGTTTAYLIARQGALSSSAGGSNFSFLHCFRYVKEEMKVEVIDDSINLRKIIRVVDNRQVKAVATEAAYLYTAVVD